MDEKMKPKESENLNTKEKLTWEAPKLYSLDKGKTEGGQPVAYTESTTGTVGRS